MAHNLLIPTYHCCSSARHAMNIASTRLQPKDTESEYRAALNIEESEWTHVDHFFFSVSWKETQSPTVLHYLTLILKKVTKWDMRIRVLFLQKDLHDAVCSSHCCSAVCVAERWGFSTRLYLGRPWWMVIGGLQRKRWSGQKGRDKGVLKLM